MNSLSALSNTLSSRYDPIFSFHYSKPIDDILRYRPHFQPSILFLQYLRLDSQDQMLKRYYQMFEFERVPLLAQYYSNQRIMEHETPLLFLTRGNKIMFKRMKRRYKRLIKFKKEQQEEERYENSETFLRTIRSEDIESTLEIPRPYNMSMESVAHDIYDASHSKPISRIYSQQHSVLIPQLTLFNRGDRDRERQRERGMEKGVDVEVRDSDVPEYLIMDFGDKDVDGILREYNSLSVGPIQSFDQSSRQQKATRFKPTTSVSKDKSLEERSSTMSKSKRTPQSSRKQTIKNVKVSQEYYQGSNPNTIQYKRMISIKQGKTTPASRRDKTRLSSDRILSPCPVPAPKKIQRLVSKEVGNVAGKKAERVRTQVERVKPSAGLRKSKQDEYEEIRNKAHRIQEEAIKVLSKYRSKPAKTKSSQYLAKSHKAKH